MKGGKVVEIESDSDSDSSDDEIKAKLVEVSDAELFKEMLFWLIFKVSKYWCRVFQPGRANKLRVEVSST